MAEKTITRQRSCESLKKGVDALNDAQVTLGPKGRNVWPTKIRCPFRYQRWWNSSKRNWTERSHQKYGAQLVKEVASKTVDVAGDGNYCNWTCSINCKAGLKNALPANPMDWSGIDKAVIAAVKGLRSLSNEWAILVTEQIASISGITMWLSVNWLPMPWSEYKEGVITVEEAKSTETYVDVVEGKNSIVMSPYCHQCRNGSWTRTILIYVEDFSHERTSSRTWKGGSVSLLIIAEDVDGEALATWVVNKTVAQNCSG